MGKDLDEVFAYATPKVVKILDRRLGLLHLALTLAVLLYILISVLLFEKAYLFRETPLGTVRLSARAPSWLFKENRTLPAYCVQSNLSAGYDARHLVLPCMTMDQFSPGFEPTGEGNIYIPTRFNTTTQTLTPAGCAFGSQGCVYLGPPVTATYTAFAEEFTFKIEATAKAPTLNVKGTSTALSGRIKLCRNGTETGEFRKLVAGADDIFTLREILEFSCWVKKWKNAKGETIRKAEVSTTLEQASDANPLASQDPADPTFESIRYAGAVVILDAIFDNTKTYDPSSVDLEYVFTRQPATEFKRSLGLSEGVDLARRKIVESHGIFITCSIAGVFGKPKFQSLLINLTSALSLLAVAKVLVEILMLYCLPERKQYEKEKFQVSEDYSDLRDNAKKGHTELQDVRGPQAPGRV
jgi:hypothetical protein